MCVHAKSLQSFPTLCDPMYNTLPGSSVHGILQARTLEWVGMPSSRGSSQPRDWTQVPCAGSTESELLDHQASSSKKEFLKSGMFIFKDITLLHTHSLQYSMYIFYAMGNQKIHVTHLIVLFTLSWWSGTKPTLSLRSASTKKTVTIRELKWLCY